LAPRGKGEEPRLAPAASVKVVALLAERPIGDGGKGEASGVYLDDHSYE
jgi:hypothetical protein